MSIPTSYPDPPASTLTEIVDSFETLALDACAVAVYGSLARGEYRPGDSDVNLAIVLARPTADVLAAIREPLHTASKSVRIQPFVVGHDELPRLADVFPIMIDDIKRHHDVIFGDGDPFDRVEVDSSDLRLQVEHELRNHLLRLRRYYLFTGDDSTQLGRAIQSSSASLVYELGALLQVAGRNPEASTRQAIFDASVEAFELDSDALLRIRTFVYRPGQSADEVEALFAALLGVVEGAVNSVDQVQIDS